MSVITLRQWQRQKLNCFLRHSMSSLCSSECVVLCLYKFGQGHFWVLPLWFALILFLPFEGPFLFSCAFWKDPRFLELKKVHRLCGFFVAVRCDGKHCSSSKVGSASSVRSCTALKVPCFEAVPEKQFSIPCARTSCISWEVSFPVRVRYHIFTPENMDNSSVSYTLAACFWAII